MSLLTAWNVWFMLEYVFLAAFVLILVQCRQSRLQRLPDRCWASSHMFVLLAYAFDTRFVSSLSYNVSTSFLHSPKIGH